MFMSLAGFVSHFVKDQDRAEAPRIGFSLDVSSANRKLSFGAASSNGPPYGRLLVSRSRDALAACCNGFQNSGNGFLNPWLNCPRYQGLSVLSAICSSLRYSSSDFVRSTHLACFCSLLNPWQCTQCSEYTSVKTGGLIWRANGFSPAVHGCARPSRRRWHSSGPGQSVEFLALPRHPAAHRSPGCVRRFRDNRRGAPPGSWGNSSAPRLRDRW